VCGGSLRLKDCQFLPISLYLFTYFSKIEREREGETQREGEREREREREGERGSERGRNCYKIHIFSLISRLLFFHQCLG
jgi:hypothetical protein